MIPENEWLDVCPKIDDEEILEKLKLSFTAERTDGPLGHTTFSDPDLDLIQDDVSSVTTEPDSTPPPLSPPIHRKTVIRRKPTLRLDETRAWHSTHDVVQRAKFLRAVNSQTTETDYYRGVETCSMCGERMLTSAYFMNGAPFSFSGLYVHEVVMHDRPVLPEIAEFLSK